MNIFTALLGKQYNILAHLPEAVLVVDENGKIYYANREAFNLFETQKLKGKSLDDFFALNFSRILENHDDSKQILKLVTEEKITKITDVKIGDVSSKSKKRYIVTVIDNTGDHSLMDNLISEKREQKILNRTKNVLLAKTSNFISTPLNSVTGFSKAMLDGLSGDLNEKQRKYLEIIYSNSSEVLLFINKLIELSKLEAEIVDVEYKNFDVLTLLSVIFNETSVKLQNRDISISVNTSDLARQNCYSEKTMLSNAITNLIDNALYMTDTGSVLLNIAHPSPEMLLAEGFKTGENISEKSYIMFEFVCKGIDNAIYSNSDVFDPYIQADKNSKKYMLQSLLLSSTKKYIEKLGGKLQINNTYPNRVTFTFIIPADKSVME